jgi:hypothetical protein
MSAPTLLLYKHERTGEKYIVDVARAWDDIYLCTVITEADYQDLVTGELDLDDFNLDDELNTFDGLIPIHLGTPAPSPI